MPETDKLGTAQGADCAMWVERGNSEEAKSTATPHMRYCGRRHSDLRHRFSKMWHLLFPDTSGTESRGTCLAARDCQSAEQQYLSVGEGGAPGSS